MLRAYYNDLRGTEGKKSPGFNGLIQEKNSWQIKTVKAFQVQAANLTKLWQNI